MSSLKIYTPGHGAFLDTLIMYGLTSPLVNECIFQVNGVAGVFEIKVEDADLHDVAELLSSTIFRYKEPTAVLFSQHLRLMKQKSLVTLLNIFDKLSDPDILAKQLKEYLSPGHALKEGRRSKGQHIWLPLFPHIGKYFAKREFRYDSVNYGVCDFCIALAALGFYRASIPIRFLRPIAKSLATSHLVLFSFEGSVEEKELGELLSFITSPLFVLGVLESVSGRRAAYLLPLSTFVRWLMATFSGDALRTIYESKALWSALSITFNVDKKGIVQVRGYEEVLLDKYLSSLISLSEVDARLGLMLSPLEKLRIVSERLISEEEVSAVESLFKFLDTRRYTDLYNAIRQCSKALDEGVGKALCEELVCLVKMK